MADEHGATRRDGGEYATFTDVPAPDAPAPDTSAHDGRNAAMTTTADATDPVLTDAPARRRGPDPLALVVGLATLAMAVFAFVGELPDLGFVDPRWLLAGGAAAVGLLLLVGNLRGRSGRRRGGS